jgi:Leucine-rich repeat (LRR) protein
VAATKVGDVGMAYFKDCKSLMFLQLQYTQTSDAGVAYFKDCKSLQSLYLNGTNVTDLSTLKDCKNLTRLRIDHTKVTDLSLLKGMPLKELTCDFRPDRDAEILRSVKTLETINGKPAAEFWTDLEKK